LKTPKTLSTNQSDLFTFPNQSN